MDHMTQTEQLEVLNDLEAEDLKSMILLVLRQEDGDQSQSSPTAQRSRKPDMRSPVEVQKDQLGKSKY